MGLNLNAYVEAAPKRFDFAPTTEFKGIEIFDEDFGIRVSQPLRKIMNTVLSIDFSTADDGINFTPEDSKVAVKALESNIISQFDPTMILYYAGLISFFKICVKNKYHAFIG